MASFSLSTPARFSRDHYDSSHTGQIDLLGDSYAVALEFDLEENGLQFELLMKVPKLSRYWSNKNTLEEGNFDEKLHHLVEEENGRHSDSRLEVLETSLTSIITHHTYLRSLLAPALHTMALLLIQPFPSLHFDIIHEFHLNWLIRKTPILSLLATFQLIL